MSEQHQHVIKARQGWLRMDWARLWRYRDLLWLTVRRDFVARYQQTILGPIWFIVQPLITALVFTLVFGRSTQPVGGPPSFVFYLAGMLAWSFFSTVLSAAGNTFQSQAGVFTKVYFPRLIVPLAMTISGVVPLVIQTAVFLVVYGQLWWFGNVTWHIDPIAMLLLPWCVVHTALFAFGLSLVTSALSAKYRDLQHALPFVLQMWLFVTPVIFPLEQLRPTAKAIALLNPLTPIVETVRRAFFGEGLVSWPMFGISLGVTAVALVAGVALFQRAERTFADTV